MDFVDIRSSLREIYSSDQEQRYRDVVRRFKESFAQTPDFFVRVPGSVAMMGGGMTTDSGFPGIHAALESDIIMAVWPSADTRVSLQHMYYIQYESEDFDGNYAKFREQPTWVNYFLAGYKVATREKTAGMFVVVDGNLPINSGLGSGTALAVAAALAASNCISHGNQTLSKDVIATGVCKYLNMITQQRRICLPEVVSLKTDSEILAWVTPNPIDWELVPMPSGISLVLLDSLTSTSKMQMEGKTSVLRQVELLLAVELIKINRKIHAPKIRSLLELQNFLNVTTEEMIEVISSSLKSQAYDTEELFEEFVTDNLMEIVGLIPYADSALNYNTEFYLQSRAKHVISEAVRVATFRELLECGADEEELGQVLYESMKSQRELFDCSTPELDALWELSRELGALGFRIAGSGWGGFGIAMVRESDKESFLSAIKEKFYDQRSHLLTHEQHYFASNIAPGACIIDTQYLPELL